MRKFWTLTLIIAVLMTFFSVGFATTIEPEDVIPTSDTITQEVIEEEEEEIAVEAVDEPIIETFDDFQETTAQAAMGAVEEDFEPEYEEYVPPSEPEVPEVLHRVTLNWILETEFAETEPPFSGTVIGSYSFDAAEGAVIDMKEYKDHPSGAAYWQPGFINYNGIPCYLAYTYAAGGKGIDSNGNPIDNLPFSFDPFSDLVMPGTDVDIYYLYAPYYDLPEVPEDTLDKIVIYVNRPTGDINPIRQNYYAYEILHVGKAPTVEEDVTTDYTVGQIMGDGFSYWITEGDDWFPVVRDMTDYFILTETARRGTYIVELNPNKPATEETAKEIARYLEDHIEEYYSYKLITADSPSYDNDPGYYLIISDINSNLVLGTTNIAITEKAEYPTIQKEVDNPNTGIGETVTFSVTVHFPQGSKAEAILSDVMTDGLTYVEDSLSVNVELLSLDIGHADDGNIVNGFTMHIGGDTIRELAHGEGGGDVTFTYNAIVNERASIGPDNPNTNSVRLDYSHFAQTSTADVYVTSFNLLKYSATDDNKTPLPGALFQLLDADKNPINLTIIENHKEYRIAMETDDPSVVIDQFITGNSVILIKGVQANTTYYIRELSAPAGYHLLTEDIQIIPNVEGNIQMEIPNSTGTVLPSTGGIGTTIFYIIGTVLIICALTLLITRRKITTK